MTAPSLERRALLAGMAFAPLALAAPLAAAAEWKKTPGMDAMTCLRTRRSVRSFRDMPVAPELVREMLAAGMSAPSAGNGQPWQFVVIEDRAQREKIAGMHAYIGFAAAAGLSVLVCCDLSRAKYGGDRNGGYWIQDLSNCSQNILLAAHALGLGGVWTGVFPVEERMKSVSGICKLPENIIPFSLLVIGHPEKTPEPADRYEPARIHKNVW